jgi:two-component system NarL family sensor kinase
MSIPQPLLTEHANRGARIRQVLRLGLVIFLAGVLITEPPADHLGWCWLLVGCYLVGGVGIYLLGTGNRSPRLLWLSLFVDVAVLAGMTLIIDTAANVSWTPYLIINGFFLIPVIAAAQLSPTICAAVVAPTVVVYLVSGMITQSAGQEPISYVLLRTFTLAAVGLGAVLLSRLQRSRVRTIAGLLNDRTALLTQLVDVEQREQQNLAETLHDGALQYVLAARQDLDELAGPQTDTVQRIDEALTESARLLRATMSQLHPAVLEHIGLLPALRDLVTASAERGRLQIDLISKKWTDGDRTDLDQLLLSTARELLTNVVKHAGASHATVHLAREQTDAGTPVAVLRVSDDGRGMGDIDLDGRLASGHLGLASRRIRIKAAQGTMSHVPLSPHGTVVDVMIPVHPDTGH